MSSCAGSKTQGQRSVLSATESPSASARPSAEIALAGTFWQEIYAGPGPCAQEDIFYSILPEGDVFRVSSDDVTPPEISVAVTGAESTPSDPSPQTFQALTR